MPNTIGTRYEPLRKNLGNRQIINAVYRIQRSGRFDVGECSHIILKGTDVVVGYVGNESLELFCPKEQEPGTYRTPHKHLRKIFRSC